MIQMPSPRSNSLLELVGLQPVGSFTPDQLARTTAVLTEAQGWAVDQHVDYEGNVMIVAAHNPSKQTLCLSGTRDRVELTRMQGDRMVSCGTFDRIEQALEALLRVVSRELA